MSLYVPPHVGCSRCRHAMVYLDLVVHDSSSVHIAISYHAEPVSFHVMQVPLDTYNGERALSSENCHGRDMSERADINESNDVPPDYALMARQSLEQCYV